MLPDLPDHLGVEDEGDGGIPANGKFQFADNTLMLFGDAKAVIGEVVADLKGGTSIH